MGATGDVVGTCAWGQLPTYMRAKPAQHPGTRCATLWVAVANMQVQNSPAASWRCTAPMHESSCRCENPSEPAAHCQASDSSHALLLLQVNAKGEWVIHDADVHLLAIGTGILGTGGGGSPHQAKLKALMELQWWARGN